MPLPASAITFGLPSCLHIPIAAKTLEDVSQYVGNIKSVSYDGKAIQVHFEHADLPSSEKVWARERGKLLIETHQIWVDVSYAGYRKYYLQNRMENLVHTEWVIDHIMNRKLAYSLGYGYVRLIHLSRKANSSSGRGGEHLAQKSLKLSQSLNPDVGTCPIIYADPMDLVKMLNIEVGGFGLDAVRDHHHLFYG